MKRTLIAIAFLLCASAANAQSISPISENFGHGKASSDVTITNDTFQPLAIQLWPSKFVVDHGQKVSSPIVDTDGIFVKLSATSLKIPPKQSRAVSVDAACSAGCNLEVRVSMSGTGLRVNNGLLLRLELGSLLYICADSAKDCRERVLVAGGVTP